MLIAPFQPMSVARHTIEVCGADQARHPRMQGLIWRVQIRIDNWQAGQLLNADAFVDPGADSTDISYRWLAENGRPTLGKEGLPTTRGSWFRGKMTLRAAGQDFPLPTPVRLCAQERIDAQTNKWIRDPPPQDWVGPHAEHWNEIPIMPGCEDVLIGRDFFRMNKLVLLMDYGEPEQPTFAILWANDAENYRRRQQARLAFSE